MALAASRSESYPARRVLCWSVCPAVCLSLYPPLYPTGDERRCFDDVIKVCAFVDIKGPARRKTWRPHFRSLDIVIVAG